MTDKNIFLVRSTIRLANYPVTMNPCRIPQFHGERGKNARGYRPETENINTNADYNLTSGQEITQLDYLTSVDPLDLLGYTFVNYNDETNQRDEVKEFLENEGNFMM